MEERERERKSRDSTDGESLINFLTRSTAAEERGRGGGRQTSYD